MKEFYKGLLVVEDDEIPYDLKDDQFIYRSQLQRLTKSIVQTLPKEFNTLHYLESNYDTYFSNGYRFVRGYI